MSGRRESHRLLDEFERRLRLRRGELDDGAKSEEEEVGVDWPLERDEPTFERDHPRVTPRGRP